MYTKHTINDVNHGLDPPYLIINGVPIDHEHSLMWITNHKKGVVK